MEVDKSIYEFGQQLLDNFDKERAETILKTKNDQIDKQIEEEEDSLLKPLDQDKLGDKYSKWDKIEQSINKREQFESKVQQDKDDLNKQFMDKMMGCDQNHSKEIDIYNRPFKEKMEIVRDFKDKGNLYFKQQNYEKASYFYAKALLQFYYIIADNKEEEDEVKPIQLSCHINQALWYHKQKRYDEGLSECYQALCIDPDNVKALYRQAALNKEKHNFEKALEDVKKGIELDPKNKAFMDLHKELKKDIKNYIQTSKKVYGKMLNDDTPTTEQSKIVEIDEDELDISYSINEEIKETINMEPKAKYIDDDILPNDYKPSNADTKMREFEKRIDKIETTVNDIKFTIDILRGYGAIPPKLPEESDLKEIPKDKSKIASNTRKNGGFIDDWVAVVALVVLTIMLSVCSTLFLLSSYIQK